MERDEMLISTALLKRYKHVWIQCSAGMETTDYARIFYHLSKGYKICKSGKEYDFKNLPIDKYILFKGLVLMRKRKSLLERLFGE